MGAAEFARGQGRHGGKRSERSKECVSSSSPSDITAVIFDLGGVLLESPFRAIDHFEEEHGLEPRSIARLVARIIVMLEGGSLNVTLCMQSYWSQRRHWIICET